MSGRAARPTGPRSLLEPLDWLYCRVAALRNALYDRGILAAHRARLPVVSVGSLVFGGAGKTPAAMWLTSLLTDRGFKVAIVSRGYRGQRIEDPLVVSRAGRLLTSHREAGDEAVLMALESRAHVVVVGRRRVEAVVLAEREGATLAILDDGFQHRRLARDVDVVLLDANPGGRGRPEHLADQRRESTAGLRRADLILLTGGETSLTRFLTVDEAPPILAEILRRCPADRRPRVAGAVQRPTGLLLPGGQPAPPEQLKGRLVLAVSGIARPSAFQAAIEELGAIVAAHIARPDHHLFDARDADAIARRARETGAELIITTAKDLVRWPAGAPAPAMLKWELGSAAGPAILEFILSRVGPPPEAESA